MRSRFFGLLIFASVSSAGLFTSMDTARADDRDRDGREDGIGKFMLALDLDYASAVDNDFLEEGGGGGIRLGSELDLVLVSLIPELSVDYHSFGGRADANVITGKLGGRIRFLKILEPGIFSHLGVGHIAGDDDFTGVAFDAGVTLDLTLLPLIDLGLHAAWNRVFGSDTHSGLSYGTFGAHVALVL
jgi:hypothetical protein